MPDTFFSERFAPEDILARVDRRRPYQGMPSGPLAVVLYLVIIFLSVGILVPIYLSVILPVVGIYLLTLAVIRRANYQPKPQSKDDSPPAADTSAAAVPPIASREFDVVVFGVTGLCGKVTAEYLLYRHSAKLRLAFAGRSISKLQAARAELAQRTGVDGANDIALIECDSDDLESLLAMARRTRVVATSVGPYNKYGEKLVRACAYAGTGVCLCACLCVRASVGGRAGGCPEGVRGSGSRACERFRRALWRCAFWEHVQVAAAYGCMVRLDSAAAIRSTHAVVAHVLWECGRGPNSRRTHLLHCSDACPSFLPRASAPPPPFIPGATFPASLTYILKTPYTTGYCDLTGEQDFVSEMARKYDSVAKATGARIIHLTGFDSIPSELMTTVSLCHGKGCSLFVFFYRAAVPCAQCSGSEFPMACFCLWLTRARTVCAAHSRLPH